MGKKKGGSKRKKGKQATDVSRKAPGSDVGSPSVAEVRVPIVEPETSSTAVALEPVPLVAPQEGSSAPVKEALVEKDRDELKAIPITLSEAAIARPWKRFSAAVYDVVLLTLIYVVTATFSAGRMFYKFAKPLQVYDPNSPPLGPAKHAFQLTVLCLLVFTWLYFTLLDSKYFRGTVGKMLFSLRVTDWERRPIGFLKANLRLLAKLLMLATLGIGFLWAVFRKNRQGLHDMMSKTLVLDTSNRG